MVRLWQHSNSSHAQRLKCSTLPPHHLIVCDALQGDDYILYCHPSRQKTPRSDRLREWYLSLLRVAKEQGAVSHLSNLWDTFFEGGRDHRDRASASLMPYFEGGYSACLAEYAAERVWYALSFSVAINGRRLQLSISF